MNDDNRREARRYMMQVPVRLGEHEGNTRDVSNRGLYFMAPPDLEVGFLMDLELELPSGMAGPLKIRVQARIIRADDLGDRVGVAARIESWEIPDGDRLGIVKLA